MKGELVYRYDRSERIEVVKTREGFILTSGRIAKPGVMIYRTSDGLVIRELVDEDVLSDAASLASLEGKALTLEHPSGDVTPDSWRDLAIGDVSNVKYVREARGKGAIVANIGVKTREGVQTVEDPKGPRELSPGYSVQIDRTPGEHPIFGAYDTRQLPGTRHYNHVALTQEARGGHDLVIRKDAAYEVTQDEQKMKKDAEKTSENTSENKFDAESAYNDMKKDMADMRKDMKKMMDSFAERFQKSSEKKDADNGEPDEKKDEQKEEKKGDSKRFDKLAYFRARQRMETIAGRVGISGDFSSLEDDKLADAIVSKVAPSEKRRDSAYIDGLLTALEVQLNASMRLPSGFEALGAGIGQRQDSNMNTGETVNVNSAWRSKFGKGFDR